MYRVVTNMASRVSDTIRELRAISYKLETIRTETRRFLEEKDRETNGLQNRINLLCTELVEGDASLIGGGSGSNVLKRAAGGMEQKPAVAKKMKPETGNGIIGGTDGGLQFCVEDGHTQVYTDGACPNNGKGGARAGVGVWWGEGHKMNLAQRVSGERQTNNVAEIQAATLSISQAMGAGITRLQVNTDSQFLINCVTQWMDNWKKKGWRTATGQEVKNKDDLIPLDKLLQQRKVQVKWVHVKGHSDNKGNNEADRLAVRGANM
eukprot:GFUD01025637.1.p1 GENE.GFUD01025637.1~~GFUD01025637.1.p1  ORF type:complete len:264 (+),score=94.85 GFUD01025637.1:60-851(+)